MAIAVVILTTTATTIIITIKAMLFHKYHNWKLIMNPNIKLQMAEIAVRDDNYAKRSNVAS